jgi:anti-sigma B factor antagonist
VNLRIERTDAGGAAVVALRGELDLEAGPVLRQALLEAIDEQPGRRVVVDLEGVDFVDSVGLGMLVGGLKRARTTGGDLVLVATGRNVLRVLELTGLTRVFELYADGDAAVRGGSSR